MPFVVFHRPFGKYYRQLPNSSGFTRNPKRAKRWAQIDYAMKTAHAKNLAHQAKEPDETPYVVRELDEDWNIVASFECPDAIAPKKDADDDTDSKEEAMIRRVRHRPKPPWHSD